MQHVVTLFSTYIPSANTIKELMRCSTNHNSLANSCIVNQQSEFWLCSGFCTRLKVGSLKPYVRRQFKHTYKKAHPATESLELAPIPASRTKAENPESESPSSILGAPNSATYPASSSKMRSESMIVWIRCAIVSTVQSLNDKRMVV